MRGIFLLGILEFSSLRGEAKQSLGILNSSLGILEFSSLRGEAKQSLGILNSLLSSGFAFCVILGLDPRISIGNFLKFVIEGRSEVISGNFRF